MVSWATACLGVHRLFPFAFHGSVLFHSLFFTSHWISLMFLLYDRRICTHSVDHSLTHCLGEFPGLGCCGPIIRGQWRNHARAITVSARVEFISTRAVASPENEQDVSCLIIFRFKTEI